MSKSTFRNACLLLFTFLGITMMGCSSDDDNLPTDGNTYKITVTASAVEERDFISFVVVGADLNQSNTVWKVNGEERTGETGVSFGKNEFTGTTKTYVIESIKPLRLVSIGTQLINYGNPLPYAIKIEKNGKTEIDVSSTLTGDGADFTKDYSF
ncbi:hypothetical protein PQ465_16800 [Sphingobacterium oryzagri]|uniref:Uncharacterized protein n=1 Tax=Sphingobacterium oryzagri TaxID=3025669 RepID=A0ABY7WHU2_9SPHI|nr:hypothetical protein [Sphingobacterium sp. KACC 22765]WDF67948.1 hypothetical protein PQ465_16800 [Sphingobacterium sp. KACC 22765]